jgi:hypothetical protein
MPGVERKGKKQFIVDVNIGKESWAEWYEWIEAQNDDLPDPEGLADHWNNMPPLAPALIEGVLRQGHKMLMAGPSKAGKSFALIELCIAIAEGTKWLGWQCAQGRVLYVNLELDRASCLHRFRDVYKALGLHPRNIDKIGERILGVSGSISVTTRTAAGTGRLRQSRSTTPRCSRRRRNCESIWKTDLRNLSERC